MSSLVTGSSGSGALTQLLAQGALDTYLSANASFTFFRTRYNKHTNFAIESCIQPFGTQVSFGAESQLVLNRNGDLVYWMYVVIDLPAITACDLNEESCAGISPGGQFPSCSNACRPCKANDERIIEEYLDEGYTDAGEEQQVQMMKDAKNRYAREKYGQCASIDCCEEAFDCPGEVCDGLANWCHWANDIGHLLVRRASIVIGGSTVDTLYNDFLFMWEELTGKSGRRLTEMVGKRYSRTQLVCDSRTRRTLWTPLPFFFTQHSGAALPLASLQFHGVRIDVLFEDLKKCIVVSGPNIAVKNCATACCLTNNDLSAALETAFVFLDTVERDRFASTSFEVLLQQNQAYTMQTSQSQISMQLNFNHPVIELIWAVRRQCQEQCNNWFNYSGLNNADPIESAALYLNNQQRFSKPGPWFRLVMPFERHSSVPDTYVYCYSFALHPEDVSPSGSCNMSRIDHVDFRLKLQEGLGREQVTVMVFARSWNILRFKEGLAGLAYAS